jgi:hypothetical protein
MTAPSGEVTVLMSWPQLVAVGRSILVIVWHLLTDPPSATTTWAGFYDTHVNAERAKRNHIRQLRPSFLPRPGAADRARCQGASQDP